MLKSTTRSLPQGRPTLSLAMIVKNEAASLERCLSAARPHVDEIVVVDTGSADGTQDIARRYADVFEEIEWPGSFAEARNHSMGLATGDYIIVLDGDEYVEDARHWQLIHQALAQPKLAALQLPVLNLLSEGRIIEADRCLQERVIRNDARLRYSGRVHNQIRDALQDYIAATEERIATVEAEIVHTGYALSPEKLKEKYRPRLQLLLAEYEEPRSEEYRAYYGYQLGVAYVAVEMYREAMDIFAELDYSLLTPQNAFYTHLLAAQAAIKLYDYHGALVHCNAMLTLDREEPMAYYVTGMAFLYANHMVEGALMLLEALNVHERAGRSVRFVLNPATLFETLARLCERIGLTRQAGAFNSLSEKRSYDPDAVRALVATLQNGFATASLDSTAA